MDAQKEIASLDDTNLRDNNTHVANDNVINLDSSETRVKAEIVSQIIADQLDRPKIDQLWSRYFAAFKKTPIAKKTAEQFRELGAQFADDPELVQFALDYLEIAEHTAKDNPKDKTYFANLKEFVKQFSPVPNAETKMSLMQSFRQAVQYENIKQTAKKLLTPSHHHNHTDEEEAAEMRENLLWALRHDNGQTPFQPVRSTYHLFTETLKHLKNHALEKPVRFTLFGGSVLGALTWMTAKPPPLLFDPEELTQENIDPMAFLTDPEYEPDYGSLDDVDPNMELPSHAEINQSFAEMMETYVPGSEKLIQHESKMKNLHEGALEWGESFQDWGNAIYDFINFRMDFAVEQPAIKASDALLSKSEWQQAYTDTVHWTAEWCYFLNTWENITFHFPILFISHAAAYKARNLMRGHETSEELDKLKNVAFRMVHNSKISLGLGIAGAVMGSIMDQDAIISPLSVWGGSIGFLIGELYNRKKRIAKPQSAYQITSEHNQKFSVFDEHAPAPEQSVGFLKKAKSALTGKFAKASAVGTAATASLIAADFQYNNGLATANILAFAMVVGPALGYNTIEDSIIHIVVALTGGTSGLARNEVEHRLKQGYDMLTFRTPPAPS